MDSMDLSMMVDEGEGGWQRLSLLASVVMSEELGIVSIDGIMGRTVSVMWIIRAKPPDVGGGLSFGDKKATGSQSP